MVMLDPVQDMIELIRSCVGTSPSCCRWCQVGFQVETAREPVLSKATICNMRVLSDGLKGVLSELARVGFDNYL